jgi:hypothetical protein
LVSLALTVAYSSEETKDQIEGCLMAIMERYRRFKAFKQEYQAAEKSRNNPEMRDIDDIQRDIEQTYEEIKKATPIVNDRITKTLISSGKHFISKVKNYTANQGNTIKTFADVESILKPTPEGLEFLRFLTGSETFKPYDRFSSFYLNQMKDAEDRGNPGIYLSPIWILITMYKTAIDTVARKGLDKSDRSLIEYILKNSQRESGIVFKTSSQSLKGKDPILATVARLVKLGKVKEAISSVNNSFTAEAPLKSALLTKLEDLLADKETEASVLRFIHSL